MTCIIGVKLADKIIIGGDRAASNGYTLIQSAVPKVFRNGLFTIGYTSSFRMGQLLQYKLNVPAQECDDDMRFMTTTFIDAVRSLFKDSGYGSTGNDGDMGGIFLVAYRDGLYKVETDFQIGTSLFPYMGCGAGQYIAYGALYALGKEHPLTLTDLEVSLQAAADFVGDVCPPFDFIEHPIGD